jgi:hypothetical protein
MSNYPDIFKSLLIRGLISMIVVGFACWMMMGASGWADAGVLFYGMACFVGVGILMGPPIARLLSESTGGLFYPVKRQSGPLPMYSIPQSRRAQGLYEEAIDAYEGIAKNFPHEVKPYIQMIDIAIVDLKDPVRAASIYQRGITALTKEDDIKLLIKMYHAICSRLEKTISN